MRRRPRPDPASLCACPQSESMCTWRWSGISVAESGLEKRDVSVCDFGVWMLGNLSGTGLLRCAGGRTGGLARVGRGRIDHNKCGGGMPKRRQKEGETMVQKGGEVVSLL